MTEAYPSPVDKAQRPFGKRPRSPRSSLSFSNGWRLSRAPMPR